MKFFFQENNNDVDTLFHALELVCEGLHYMSETDFPVLPFIGSATDEVTAELILQQMGGNADAPVEEIAFDGFFNRLTEVSEWFREAEKKRAKKFLDLQRLLEENLRQRKVFRIGKIRVDIVAAGVDRGGRLVGVMTKAVET